LIIELFSHYLARCDAEPQRGEIVGSINGKFLCFVTGFTLSKAGPDRRSARVR